MSPLVSVVMPTYNNEETILKSIDSVFIQDIELELIIVDDCSGDKTGQIVRDRIKNSDDNITYVKNEHNMGAAYSRNKGVSMAKGTYIAFLDADDIWKANKLNMQLKQMNDKNVVICGTSRELMLHDGSLTGKIIKAPRRSNYKRLLYGNVINCSSVLIRADLMKAYPMTDDDIHEDYITWLRILRDTKGYAVFLEFPYLLYRLSRDGKSSNKLKSAISTFKVYRRLGFDIPKSLVYFCGYAVSAIIKYSS